MTTHIRLRVRHCAFAAPAAIREWLTEESAKHALTGMGLHRPPRHPLHSRGL
ncbi:hypothetical protein GCM10017778_32890 [Streptomyces vinaceus]|nr:hypothetical protein GCM10017778_32890 [Streptomyces vinaceus]